jgi:hypothetical protein
MRTPREVLLGYTDGPVTEDYSRDDFIRGVCQTIEDLEPDPYHDEGPKFTTNEAVLIATDPRRTLKTEFPFTRGMIVRYLGRGTYLVSTETGAVAKYNQKSLLAIPAMELDTMQPIPHRADTSSPHPGVARGDTPPLRRSARSHRPPVRFSDYTPP